MDHLLCLEEVNKVIKDYQGKWTARLVALTAIADLGKLVNQLT